jgi:hypothetical protein
MLSRRKIHQERCRVEGLLAVLDALVQRQAAQDAAGGHQHVEDADPGMLPRLRHRASLHLLRLQLLVAVPEVLRQDRSTQALEHAISQREELLRKSGLPLLHSKLADAFVCSVPGALSNELRGADRMIAELVEKLMKSRDEWLADAVRKGRQSLKPDARQLAREADIERALRLYILYCAAQHSYAESSAEQDATEHLVLLHQEKAADKICSAMGGTGEETTVALALFWLDAVDVQWHMQVAAQLLCRPGLAAVLGSLGLASWCHRFLTLSARFPAPPETGSMELEACRAMQQEDAGHLGVEDVSDYVLALVAHKPLPHAVPPLALCLASIARRLAVVARVSLLSSAFSGK